MHLIRYPSFCFNIIESLSLFAKDLLCLIRKRVVAMTGITCFFQNKIFNHTYHKFTQFLYLRVCEFLNEILKSCKITDLLDTFIQKIVCIIIQKNMHNNTNFKKSTSKNMLSVIYILITLNNPLIIWRRVSYIT